MTDFLPLRSAPSGPKFVGVNQDDTLLWDTTRKAWYVGPGGGGGAVSSVFGRTGAVVAATGDYDSDQVDNVSGVPGSSVSDALDNLAAAIVTELPLPDGTLAAPSLAFANDLQLGLYRDPATGLMGFARDAFQVFGFGDDTIANLEPTLATVRYAMRAFVPPIDGVNESAVFYSRLTYSVSEQQQAVLYFEITDTQVDTYGAPVKIIHDGHGDAMYVAMLNDGVGFECATFADGSRGIISTLQEPATAKPNAVLIQTLWESTTVPNFGMFFADGAIGNAFTVRKLAGSSDGVTQIRIIERDALSNRQRFGVYNDGAIAVSSLAADAGNVTRESPEYRTEGAYWDGAATQTIGHVWKTVVTDDSPAAAEIRWYERPSGVLLAILRNAGGVGQLDMQLGSVVNVASIQSANNGDYYAAGALCLQLLPPVADNDTSVTLRIQVGGVESTELVLLGPEGSGGAGYRALRVQQGAAGDPPVLESRQVATDGTTLTGGGNLSADRTLSVANGGIGTTQLAGSATTGAVTPGKLDPIDSSQITTGVQFVIIVPFAAGGGGAADDITIPDQGFKWRMLDAWTVTTTAGAGGSTLQLRTASGGGGSTMTTTMSIASTTAIARNNAGGNMLAAQTVANGSQIFGRRSDNAAAGVCYITGVRID